MPLHISLIRLDSPFTVRCMRRAKTRVRHSPAYSIMASRFAQAEGLLPISQQALFALSSLAYHDTKAWRMNEDEKSRLVRTWATKANDSQEHGLLTVGKVRPKLCCRLHAERACASDLVRRVGGPCCRCRIQYFTVRCSIGSVTVGQAHNHLAGLLRKLDRMDSSYRE